MMQHRTRISGSIVELAFVIILYIILKTIRMMIIVIHLHVWYLADLIIIIILII